MSGITVLDALYAANTLRAQQAVARGDIDVLGTLVGLDMEKTLDTENGDTLLTWAARHNQPLAVAWLLARGADIERTTARSGASALYIAATLGHFRCAELLCVGGAGVERKPPGREPPLIVACEGGYVKCARVLCNHGADGHRVIDRQTGTTVLLQAVTRGQTDIVRVLLDAGAVVDAGAVDETEDQQQTPLFVACSMGYSGCVKLLCDADADVDCENGEFFSTALHASCQHQHAECVSILIRARAMLNPEDDLRGYTPLMLACLKGDAECTRLLIEAGAAKDIRSWDGATALYASQMGHRPAVQMLCDAGADLSRGSVGGPVVFGSTPLHMAAQAGHVNCLRLLCDAGAPVDQVNGDREPALVVACAEHHADCVRVLCSAGAGVNLSGEGFASPLAVACAEGSLDCARLLCEFGADIGEKKGDALLFACMYNNPECVQLLCEKGADVNLSGDFTSALSRTCANGYLDCARVLCDFGADLSRATTSGCTALHFACMHGHPSCVQLLCEKGADANLPLKDGRTPLLISCAHGHISCAQVISSFGASREPVPDSVDPDATPETEAEEWAEQQAAEDSDSEDEDDPAELLLWLQLSRDWTPLHHLEQLTLVRARALLRGGADLHVGSPSPLERAHAQGGEVGELLQRAARWSEHSHALFPAPARGRAVELLQLGYLLASAHYETEATSLIDVWRHIVLPHAVTRDYVPPPPPPRRQSCVIS
jgi:ankyrin repeat protein